MVIGIQDISRMGVLRFKTELDGPFLAEETKNSIPIWTSIRELEQASYFLEKEDITIEEEKNCVQHCCYEYG